MTGIGMGGFSRLAEGVLGQVVSAHNTWLSVAAELGLVGLAIFSTMTLFMILSATRTSGHIRGFGLALVSVWIINASMGTDTYQRTTWMVYALVSALPSVQAKINSSNIFRHLHARKEI